MCASAAAAPPAAAQHTARPAFGIAAVLVGASTATLFGRLLSVGAPDLRAALHVSFDAGAWISTAYSMGLMFIGPFSVYLGGLLGARRVLLAGALGFALLSAALPFCRPLPVLYAALVAAGLTAGVFYPLTLSFMLRSLPPAYLHYGIAAYALDIVVSTHVAHSYEGWATGAFSWRLLFWTGTVLAALMFALVYHGMAWQPLPQPKPGQPPISWRGFFYASLGAALLYGALDQGQRLDWWRSGTFVAMVATGAFLLVCTAVRHFVQPHPLVDLPFLRSRNILLLGVVVILFRFVLLASVVLVPSFLSTVRGYRPELIGPVLAWLAVPQVLAGALAVGLLGRVDSRLIVSAGFALVAVGCVMNAQVTTAWAGNNFEASQLVLALGEGIAFNGMVGTIVLNLFNTGRMQEPAAALSFGGFFQTIRLMGGECGASFIPFFLHHRQVIHRAELSASLLGGAPSVLARSRLLSGAMHLKSPTTDLASARASALLAGSVSQQGFILSVADAFTLLAYAATSCLFVVVCLRGIRVSFRQIIHPAAPAAPATPAPAPEKQPA